MIINLQIVSCLFILTILTIIIYILRKGKITIKYALVWVTSAFVLLLFLIFASLFIWLTNILGFSIGSNVIFAGLITKIIFINIILTVIVSEQNNKIRLLI